MDPGLNLKTREEIQRIEIDASNDPQTASDIAPEPQLEKVPKKRKTREKLNSKWWQYFTRGPTQEDGSYDATCNYCGAVIKMSCQRSTS
jgi:BED zinc finger